MLKKIFVCALSLGLIILIACGAGFYWLVVKEPGDDIKFENIRRILSKESEVYYSDGVTKLGVFFETAHRQYISYEEIPKNFVNALVAAEDDRFFSHFGFDPIGIVRALVHNLKAGRIVEGGSTLTQQTAKNLFKRSDRSLESKIKELLFALRLEYHYPKEKIFEFYANQFYVSGNGHGLGVAARYYFNKTPDELSLVECAFIAGSVKRPNYYNPFIKKTDEGIDRAKSRGKTRLEYVLGKMRDHQMISDTEYNSSLAKDIVFNQGKVGYSLDYTMEMVRDAVSSNEVSSALEAKDISNIATAGVKIITTIDKKMQEHTLSVLRHELSLLDVRLRGYERSDVQDELANTDYSGDATVQEGEFLFGSISDITGKGKNVKIEVDLEKKLGKGIIDATGLTEIVRARVKWQKNLWSEPGSGDQDQLVEQIHKNDRVWISVRTIEPSKPIMLNLEKYPQVQGGALVLKDGVIQAMAGGTENRFFNRAIQAKRQMGSAFKPLVFTAAVQLGWNTADMLNNSRNIFVLHGRPYFPRPDHKSPFEWVSMDWAGVHSENLASIWLLTHLCDHLSSAQFREVAEKLGMAPAVQNGVEESYRAYSTRMRDRFGIQVNREILRAAAYRAALESLEVDFIFDGLEDEYRVIKNLPYGLNFDKFSSEIEEEGRLKDDATKIDPEEVAIRKKVLANRYVSLAPLREELATIKNTVERFSESIAVDPMAWSQSRASIYSNRAAGDFVFCYPDQAPPSYTYVDMHELRNHLQGLGDNEAELFWQKIKLRGSISVGTFDKIEKQVEEEYQKLIRSQPYSFEVLSQLEDFRITVGLYYLIELANRLGVKGKLEPVLSFPLGANVVTLLEATRMYEGLITGSVTTFAEVSQEDSNDSLAIIDRIETEDGQIVYRPKPTSKRVVDEKTTLAISGILENVVRFGTGKTANEKVRMQENGSDPKSAAYWSKLAVPLLGKTGTTNNYANAAFFGYLPGINENGSGMVLQDGYTVGVYVGFDNNQPMKRKANRISGAAGALPTWIDIVNSLLLERGYTDRLDPVEIALNGLLLRRKDLGQLNIGIASDRGGEPLEPVLPVTPGMRSPQAILTFGLTSETGKLIEERNFQPYWKIGNESDSEQ